MRPSAEIITAFLPCRQGSQRVSHKNVRPFGPYSHGLLEIKLSQLLSCNSINNVVLSTNDETALNYANSLANPRLIIHRRDDALSSSCTSTDDLVGHARGLISSGHILWTHVTSPFFGATLYDETISAYFSALTQGYDSCMTTTPVHSYLWGEGRPINYDRTVEKWPRTQTLKPIHEINSAVFLASVDIYDQQNDRIGANPLLYPITRLAALDIDWEEDFIMAEQLLLNRIVSI